MTLFKGSPYIIRQERAERTLDRPYRMRAGRAEPVPHRRSGAGAAGGGGVFYEGFLKLRFLCPQRIGEAVFSAARP